MKKTIYLRMEEKTMATLKEISVAEKRSMSNIVGLIVEDRLAELEPQKGEIHANK